MKRLVQALAALALLAPAARATWSVVAVNTKTGEVCVAGATCIPGVGLKNKLAVVLVGKGGAAAQSQVDTSGENRTYIWNGILNGLSPAQIVQDLSLLDGSHQTRQYGIVTMIDAPATFTGSLDGLAASGVAGIVGDLRYAIQGNVLTGDAVVTDAEAAFLATDGDLSQRVIAAMEAARARGGDGRCSCNMGGPTACGCPPPSFDYSSYTSFFVVARMGDVDGTCPASNGCANGAYYCDLRAISLPGGPEPVELLIRKYTQWREDLGGVADHLLTRVRSSAQRLPADGIASMVVDVELVDVDGHDVTGNPTTLAIASVGDPVATVGSVTDHGGGHFSFPVTASTQTGTLSLAITVQHGSRNVRLWPNLVVPIEPVTELFSGFHTVKATDGASVPLWLNLGAARASTSYHVLGSAAGTSPGIVFQGLPVPLNCDTLLRASVNQANNLRFQSTLGALDAQGHAEARFAAPPGLMKFYVGRRMDWAAVLPGHVTNVVGFDVVP